MTDDPSIYELENFPELMLGQKVVYPWQKDVLREVGVRGSQVCLVAGNGTGKTSCVALAAILWHMIRFPGSLAVVTAGAYRQLTEALWPYIREKTNGLGGEAVGWNVTEDKVTLTHKDGSVSRCIGFSVTDPYKAEGHHRQGRDQNLLCVIDEAKSVPDLVFEAFIVRCHPSRMLVMSSPGEPAGMFYRLAKGLSANWKLFKVTVDDCPHISQEKMKAEIEFYGINSPIIRSAYYAEFVEEVGGLKVLPMSVLNMAIENKVKPMKGVRSAGLDFAAGGDENVFSLRNGNETEKRVFWKDKDTMRAVGRFITEIKGAGLEGRDCWADAGGMGIVMCDALRDAGIAVNRVNNGESAFDDSKYFNRGTEMWVRYARMIETGRIVPPTDETVKAQLTSRGMKYNSKGKLQLESKEDMRARGIPSPDRADADILSFMGGGEFTPQGQNSAFETPNFHEQLDEILTELYGGRQNALPGCHVA